MEHLLHRLYGVDAPVYASIYGKCDPVLSQLADYIISGWPGSMNELPEPIRPYWCFRDEFAILDRLIMKGSRVVVLSALRSETLGRLHDVIKV